MVFMLVIIIKCHVDQAKKEVGQELQLYTVFVSGSTSDILSLGMDLLHLQL